MLKNTLFPIISSIFIVGLFSLVALPAFAWDLSTLTYNNVNFSISSQDTSPPSVYLKPDGTKMYVLARDDNHVLQYTLSTPWDVSSASYDSKLKDVTSQEGIAEGLFFGQDGTKMYITGQNHDTIFQYTLATAWDVSTASYSNKSFHQTQTISMGMYFRSDGLKMYILGSGNNSINGIFEYSLSTAWDVSTASYDNKSFLAHPTLDGVSGGSFNSGGTKMYLVNAITGTLKIFQYTLSTPWDVSTASYDNVSSSVTQDSLPSNIFWKPDGTRLYLAGYNSDTIYQYSVTDSTAPFVTGISPTNGQTGASNKPTLTINFSESVDIGSGNITIKKSSDNSTVETLSVNSGQIDSVSSYIYSIDTSKTLDSNTQYYVQIDSGAFVDLSNNSYTGISNTTSWTFTTSVAAQVSSSSPSAPGCSDQKPENAPHLFELSAKGTSVTLYFVPSSGSNTGYYVSYGLDNSAMGFGTEFNYSDRSGVIPYTVNSLFPATWYFKVRGQNGCMPGAWSQVLPVKISLFGTASAISSNSVLGTATIEKNSPKCTNYTVHAGDSLWKIATVQLGSGAKFQTIMQQNSLQSSLIHTGQKLKVGC